MKTLARNKALEGALIVLIVFVALVAPFRAYAQESLHTPRLDASFEADGDWVLTDATTHVTWHGTWVSDRLMKVAGSDGSCFILTEKNSTMVQLDCKNLTEISVALAG